MKLPPPARNRLIAALVCSGLSSVAIYVSVSRMEPLWLAAWVAYGVLLAFWVPHNRAPKALVLMGCLLGVTSVLLSPFFIALPAALPAIGLMVHVAWRSLRPAAHAA